MRLFKRGETYYVEYGRGDKQSLKTSDEKTAMKLFKRLKREWLEGKILRLDESNVTLKAFMDEYIENRKHSISPRTARHDALSLSLLCDAIGGNTPLKLVNVKRIEEFKRVCLARGIKPVSVNSYLRHIKAALSDAEEAGLINARPKIKMIKTGDALPHFLRPEEIEIIMRHARSCRPEFHRMLVMYLWTGARRNELLALQWTDCHLDNGSPFVILTGKGNKQRSVPLLPQALEVLTPYRRDIGPVFQQWNESTLTHWYKAIARDCEVESHLHDLRHTAATYMAASGIPLRVVQEIMGHASISTTQIYADVIKERLHSEMSKLRFE